MGPIVTAYLLWSFQAGGFSGNGLCCLIFLHSTLTSDISYVEMKEYSTRQAAERLGMSLITMQRHLAAGRIPAPAVRVVGGGKLRIWTDEDIERVRKILPKIKNGRKTRYQKQKKKTQPKKK